MTSIARNEWLSLSEQARSEFATNLVRTLPANASFRGLMRDSSIALFDVEGSEFVLVPGGDFQIGFDADRWQPTDEELESWRGTAEEYELDPDPIVHLRTVLNPLRTICVPTMLVESHAGEFGWKRLSESDVRVRKLAKQLRSMSRATAIHTSQDGDFLRVGLTETGVIRASVYEGGTHRNVVCRLVDGQRLPTSDEWEYLCAGGTATLFHWGDHVPCDRYPTDVSPDEAAWRREWVLSLGKLERPAEGFVSDRNHHCVPNGFGLTIATNPYESELVLEPDILRGGDGGCSICGGVGFFAGWLPLASAYFESDFCRRDPKAAVDPEFNFVRRVFEIA